MNTDIRILTNFKGHRKRKRLKIILGHDGTGYLIDLWLTVATDAPSGVLVGWDSTDIAIASGWDGDHEPFVNVLIQLGFVDLSEDGVYSIHDWEATNGYAAHAAERSEKARKAAIARYSKQNKYDAQDATSMLQADNEHTNSNAPSPTPTPTPSPNPNLKESKAPSRTADKKVSWPEGFTISERVRLWAAKNKHNHLEEQLEAFRLKCAANGYKYQDWDAAFMNALRENWARIEGNEGQQRSTKKGVNL